jgi:molybdate transport system ATP-binding protein
MTAPAGDAPALIALDSVTVDHYGAVLLRGVTWAIRPGEHWAVLGGNGAGKSSLLRLLRGELWPHHDGGRRVYTIDGPPTESSIDARRRIALVSSEHQDAYRRHEWRITAHDALRTGLTGAIWMQGTLPHAEEMAVADMAARLGVAHLLGRDMTTLSTGEARRVLLGRALLGRPRLLLLDEFCNGLDTAAREALLETIASLAGPECGLVMTSHRPEEFPRLITHTLRLAEGRVVGIEPGPPPPAPRASRAVKASPSTRRRRAAEPLVELLDCRVVIAGTTILHDINWTLRRGEHWMITGPNGSGKSTFLRLVTGELWPYWGGIVRRFGAEEGLAANEIARRIGVVSGDLQVDYHHDIAGGDVVASGLHGTIGVYTPPTSAQRRRVAAMLARLGIEHLADRPFQRLSYGERRRLLLARALVHRPEILVLDEPCNGMDAPAREQFLALVDELARAGTTILYVTHHHEETFPALTHRATLAGGRIVHQGPLGHLQSLQAVEASP